MRPAYLCIDLKSFYASAECVFRHLDPLKARLVVADESRTDKTICLAVSPALKALGVSSRPRLFEVKQHMAYMEKKLGKELPFLIAPPQMQRYIEVSSEIYRLYLDILSPEDIHVYSIDEVFIDAAPYLRLMQMDARSLAAFLIQRIYDETGITATAGIGSNLYLAKIAMDIVAKHLPGDEKGMRIAELDEAAYCKTLWHHKPLTDFWRIGPGIAKRLAACRMTNMGDIAAMSRRNEELLYQLFGVDAQILIDHAWGREPCTMADIKAYRPKSHGLSMGQVLPEPYTHEEAALIVREMAEQLALDLTAKALVTDSLTLHIGFDRSALASGRYCGPVCVDHYGRKVPKPAHGSVTLKNPTDLRSKIVSASLQLFEKTAEDTLPVRRITLTAGRVKPKASVQIQCSFFDAGGSSREDHLQKTFTAIQNRYGKNALFHGCDLLGKARTLTRNKEIGGHRA
ncbi:MAG: DNA methylase [Pseudoramibacter sp.]